MVRLLIVIAVLVILTAYSYLVYRVGRSSGVRSERSSNAGIDIPTYDRMASLIRSLKAQPLDLDQFVMLPKHLDKEAQEVIKQISVVRHRPGR